MIDRRTFSTLLASAIAAPKASFAQDKASLAQNSMPKNVFYSAVGPDLTLYGVDADNAALVRQGTVSTPANIQYAWPHPSKRYLYVVSSNGGPGGTGGAGDTHVANAFAIDPAPGVLKVHGEAVKLPSRPIHTGVDASGQYLLIAHNNPSSVSVHRIKADGSLGERVNQPEKLDTGIFAHQILVTPDNRQAILVTRGNNAPSDNPVDPGLRLQGRRAYECCSDPAR